MKLANIIAVVLLVFVMFVATSMFLSPQVGDDLGAVGGLPSYIQSSATTSIAADTPTLIASETNYCSSRVITTNGDEITLLFGLPSGGVATSSMSAVVGHVQSASTTVAYESSIYGCGDWYGYSVGGTDITISTF